MQRKRLIATVTNLSYVLSGIWLIGHGVVAAGVFSVLMGLASGIHHAVGSRYTRLLDYAGMYGLLCSIFLSGLPVDTHATIAVSAITTCWILFFLKDSRVAVGVLVAAVFGLMLFQVGIYDTMQVATIGAIAFVFNTMGDTEHSDYHSLVHGLGWHLPSAWTAMQAAKLLEGAL